MVDVALKPELKTYVNGTLAGTPNAVYDEIVNWEIAKPSHKKRKSNNSFMLKKRRGFKQAFSGVSITGTITDVKDLTDLGETFRYYYSVTDTNYYVYKRKLSACTNPTLVDSGTRCPGMYDKFIVTDFVKGPKKRITTGGLFNHTAHLIADTGYPQATGNIASFTYDWQGTANSIGTADYIWVWNSTGAALQGQVRKIIDRVSSGYNSRDTLIVDSPWETGLTGGGSEAGAVYSIFPRWGDVLLYAGIDSGYMGASDLNCVKIIHSPYTINSAGTLSETDTITTIFNTINLEGTTNRCVTTMAEHNQSVIIQYDNGFSVYGAQPTGTTNGYYKFYHTVDEQIFFGTDIKEIVSFRNFVIGFGDNKIKAAVFFEGNQTIDGQVFELRDNLGIRNTGAHAQFDNSMRFVASNRRLYSVSIGTDGDRYLLDLQDQSNPILGHMDEIEKGDSVYMDVNENEMKIYHVNKSTGQYDGTSSSPAGIPNRFKTKIIIFDKDYNLIHTWETSRNIRGQYKEEYMVGGVTAHLCGNIDIGSHFPEARVSLIIGDSEPTSEESNFFEKKAINWAKVLLGHGIYNSSHTFFRVFTGRDGYKTVRYVAGIGNIDVLNKWATWSTTGTFTNNNCLQLEGEESIYTGEVGGRDWDRAVADDRCGPSSFGCPTHIEEYANGVKIASPIDALSGFVVIPVPIRTQPSDFIQLDFVCRGGDMATFGGLFVEVQKSAFDDTRTYGDNVMFDPSCSSAISGINTA